MGTSKKFVLASILSAMLVLAFMTGLAPTHDAPTANAANNGRISMVDLLTAAGFNNGNEKPVGVTVTSPLDGFTIKVSQQHPPTTIPIPMMATASTDTITYGAQVEGDDLFGINSWGGSVISDTYTAPYVGNIDIASFLTGTISTTSLGIYAFGMSAGKTALLYDEVNEPAERVRIDLMEFDTTTVFDNDINGYPLSPFTLIEPNEIWATTVTTNGQERTVFIVNLETNVSKAIVDPDVVIRPTPDSRIAAPSLSALQNAGMVGGGETALLVIELVSDLEGLLDHVDGDSSPGALNAWAAARVATQPGNLLALSQYMEISLAYTLSGGTVWDEIDTFTGGLDIDLTLSNLPTPDGEIELHSLPTLLVDGTPFSKGGGVGPLNDLNLTNSPGPQNWSEVPNVTVANDELTVSLTSLSVFAPLDVAGIRVDSITPDETPAGVATPAFIGGVFGNLDGMNAAQAAAIYKVYLNGVELTFNDILKGGLAIEPRATLASTTNMAVQVPDTLAMGLYDVTVTEIASPEKTDTLTEGFEVLGNYTLTYDVDGTGFGNVDASIVTKGGYPAVSGPHEVGTQVQLLATPNLGSAFVGWSGETTNLTSTSNPSTTWTALASDNVVATFNLLYNCYTIYVDAGTGGSADISGASSGECAIDSFPDGTIVSVEAVPNSGFIFSHWDGDDVDEPNNANTTILLDDNKTIEAIFTPVGSPVLLSVTPDSAWVFGGVVARATGVNLSPETDVIIGGQLTPSFNHDPGGTYVDFIVPATLNNTNTAVVLADVAVINSIGSTAIPNGFIYKRHQVNNGVNESAAVIDTSGGTVQVTLGSPHADFAQIEVLAMSSPAKGGELPIYVIARNAQQDPLKGSPVYALGTEGINEGNAIPGAYDFTIHLYTDNDTKGGFPAVGSATLQDVTNTLIDDNFFDRPIDSDGDPQPTTPMLLTAPLTDTSLSNNDIRNSVTIWSTPVTYDYVAESVTPSKGGPLVAYNSEVYNNEVDAAITSGSAGGASPDLLDQGRLYALNGFTLRQDAILPQDDADGIRLSNASGTGTGSTSGGTALTIISPMGGLANIDRIEVVEAIMAKSQESFPLPDKGNAPTLLLVTEAGTDEYTLEVITPPYDAAGTVNFVIYGKGNPALPIATLEDVFEYTQTTNTGFLAFLIGLLMALLGISAGDPGSPCFIASAAYGTPLADEINVLREVRDTYLLDNALGSAFVDTYYHISPYIADQVAASPLLAAVVRSILIPVIFLGKVALHTPALLGIMVLTLGALYLRRRKARAQS